MSAIPRPSETEILSCLTKILEIRPKLGKRESMRSIIEAIRGLTGADSVQLLEVISHNSDSTTLIKYYPENPQPHQLTVTSGLNRYCIQERRFFIVETVDHENHLATGVSGDPHTLGSCRTETQPYILMHPQKDEESVIFWPLLHDLECPAILKLCDFSYSGRFSLEDLEYIRPIANAVANLFDLFNQIDYQAEQVQVYETLLAEAQEQVQKLKLGERLSYQFLTATSHLHELAGLFGGMASDREEVLAVIQKSSLPRADKERLTSVIDRLARHRKEALDKIRQLMSDRPERDNLFKKLFNIKDVINEQIAIYEPQFEREGIRVKKSLRAADLFLVVDSSAIKYVIRIIINNAMLALADGSARPKKLEIVTLRGPRNLNLRFTDNGIGIPRDAQKRIFEAFFTTRKTGSGIGLYWAKRTIEEEHGGKLWLDRSLPNLGSTFVISLPLQEGA